MSSPEMQRTSVRPLAQASWLMALIISVVGLPLVLQASPPQWWYDRGVIADTQTPNDYAAVNQGQVKFIAEQAAAEMDAHLPGGAGQYVHAKVDPWIDLSIAPNNYAAVKLGSLKELARPFYDRLKEVGYVSDFPWAGHESLANNYAAANIGQVKNLFSFDLTSTDAAHDANSDGLPDWWENFYDLSGVNAAATIPWNSNLTYLQAFQQRLNPIDFFDRLAPQLAVFSGNKQIGRAGGFVPLPLIVTVIDGNSNPLVNAPIAFAVSSGGGQLQKSSSTSSSLSIIVYTDSTGQAKAFFRLPLANNNTSKIIVSPGSGDYSANVSFTESSDDGNSSNSYNSPFDPTNIIGYRNADGSEDLSWENHTDDQTPVIIYREQANNTWTPLITLPAGTNSYHIPAQ